MDSESLDFLKFFLPFVAAACAWYVNESRKLAAEIYERKERKYAALIEGLQGFMAGVETDAATKLKQQFLRELNNCWMYCPDEVIRKGYGFLNTVGDSATDDTAKEIAVGEFMVAIRKDLLSRKRSASTSLGPKVFKLLRAS